MDNKSYLSTNIEDDLQRYELQSFQKIYWIHKKNSVKKWGLGILVFLLFILFLPWTQNIRAKGVVTTLKQEGFKVVCKRR
jgi:hypothetical protein